MANTDGNTKSTSRRDGVPWLLVAIYMVLFGHYIGTIDGPPALFVVTYFGSVIPAVYGVLRTVLGD